MYDVIIVGAGPAGLSAAVYAKRAMLNTLVLEKNFLPGGQILNTYEIDNYLGLPASTGMGIAEAFREHAKKLGAEFVTDTLVSIEGCVAADGKPAKRLITKKGSYEAKTVILAMGASHRLLGAPGESKLLGMGVSYCATCDGAFYKGATVAVVGGGDVALEDALFLARGCEKVYLIHRRGEFRGAKVLQEQVKSTANIELVLGSVVDEIRGEEEVSSILVRSLANDSVSELAVAGIFIAVGTTPNVAGIEGLPESDEAGYIVANEDGCTSIPGIFAAGDLRTKQLRQVITAAADGANCVASAERYLNML